MNKQAQTNHQRQSVQNQVLRKAGTVLLALLSPLFLLFLHSCGPEDHKPKEYPPNQTILDFFQYKTGTQWIYENQTTGRPDTIYVRSHENYYQDVYEGKDHLAYKDYYFTYVPHRSNTDMPHRIEYISSQIFDYKGAKRHQVLKYGFNSKGGSVFDKLFITPMNDVDSMISTESGLGYLKYRFLTDSFMYNNQWVVGEAFHITNTHSPSHYDQTFKSKWMKNVGMYEFEERGEVYKLKEFVVFR